MNKFEPITYTEDIHDHVYVRNQRRTIVTPESIRRIITTSNFKISVKELTIDFLTHTSNYDIVEGIAYLFECAFGFNLTNLQLVTNNSSHYKCTVDVLISSERVYWAHPIYWDGDSMYILPEEFMDEMSATYGDDVSGDIVNLLTYVLYQILYSHFGIHNLYCKSVRFDVYYEKGLLYLRNLYELE